MITLENREVRVLGQVIALLEVAGEKCRGEGFLKEVSDMCKDANPIAFINLMQGLEAVAFGVNKESVEFAYPQELRLAVEQGLIAMATHHPELSKDVVVLHREGLTKVGISKLAYKVAKEMFPENMLKDLQSGMTKLGECNE